MIVREASSKDLFAQPQAIVAIDIAAFGDVEAFKARVDTLVRDLRGSRRMPGVERIWLPGEQSRRSASPMRATAYRSQRN